MLMIKALLRYSIILSILVSTTYAKFEPKIRFPSEDLREKLDPQVYAVTQNNANEFSHTGDYYQFFEQGQYDCIVCEKELFNSKDKYDHPSGWAAFSKASGDVAEVEDGWQLGEIMYQKRNAVKCENCGSHLGFVFTDGPEDKGGMRYSINSASLNFTQIL